VNWTDIASLATAAGTLVLAVATFSSVKSANRAARAAERSLLAAVRPVLIPSREEDPDIHVMFGDGHRVVVPGHGGVVEPANGDVYMALGLRNAGSGLAVLHGWRAEAYNGDGAGEIPEADAFVRQQLDIYIPAGDAGFWQGRVRGAEHPDERGALAEAIRDGRRVFIDLLYGDYQGGQRTIVRFSIRPAEDGDGRVVQVLRYWNVDDDDPRERETAT
jgi:hypothetical protein